jgi:hypothetical protein
MTIAILVGGGIVIAIVLLIYLTVPKTNYPTIDDHSSFRLAPLQFPKITDAIYEEKIQVLWVKWSTGNEQHFKGSCTVWHSYPMMKRMPTSTESELCDIWEYIKEHGNPYPTAHLKDKPTPPEPPQDRMRYTFKQTTPKPPHS